MGVYCSSASHGSLRLRCCCIGLVAWGCMTAVLAGDALVLHAFCMRRVTTSSKEGWVITHMNGHASSPVPGTHVLSQACHPSDVSPKYVFVHCHMSSRCPSRAGYRAGGYCATVSRCGSGRSRVGVRVMGWVCGARKAPHHQNEAHAGEQSLGAVLVL